eukprot:jgi/Tetstr1/454258/TSEL_041177.t1
MEAEREEALATMRELGARTRADRVRTMGEIYTPVELAERMLDALPPSVWRQRRSRWLDPAGGFGVFPVLAFFRFMEGLAGVMPSERERRRHIVGNILHVVELDPDNAANARRLLRRVGGGAAPQVHQADFLTWAPAGARFDVVMGNPPYNARGLNKGGALWVRFVRKSVDAHLSAAGWLLMVHPPGWRKPPTGGRPSAGDLWARFRSEGTLVRVEIHADRRPPFPEVDWYAWRRGPGGGGTTAARTVGGVGAALSRPEAGLALRDMPFLPSVITRTTVGLLRRVIAGPGDPTFAFVRDNRFRYAASEATGPIAHAHYWDEARRDYRTLGLTPGQVRAMTGASARGRVPAAYTASKVVMTVNAARRAGELYPRHFPAGTRMGVTTNVMYQEMPAGEAAAGVRFFSSDLVWTVMMLCQYSSAPHRKNEPTVVNSLRRPTAASCRSEAALHRFYGLEDAERRFVRDFSRARHRPGRLRGEPGA